MAHTPGPWIVVNGTAVAPQWAPNERVAKTIAVNLRADEDGAFPEFGEWQHDDAHLIAAAPEMLAALLDVWRFEGVVQGVSPSVWQKVSAAINKAEGRGE